MRGWTSLVVSFVSIAASALPKARPNGPKALLEILCVPSSKIYIDGKVVGRTRFPLFTNIKVTPGRHRFACQPFHGAKSQEEIIEVAPGEVKVLQRRVE